LRIYLLAHGFIMNGGVLDTLECLTDSELLAAQAGYRYYRFDSAADLLSRAKAILETGGNLEFHEIELDQQYAEMIPNDSFLAERFEEHLLLNPSEYAPTGTEK